MRLNEFIRANRVEIEAGIRRYLGQPNERFTVDELEQWVNNDEGLYNWARNEGVRI